jgi:hypothetical protein
VAVPGNPNKAGWIASVVANRRSEEAPAGGTLTHCLYNVFKARVIAVQYAEV